MKRVVVVALATVLLLATVATAAYQTGNRNVAPPLASRQLLAFSDVAAAPPSVAVDCQTLACLNKQLTKLSDFVDHFYACTAVLPVSQYIGYLYDYGDGSSPAPTTGLDYTEDVELDRYQWAIFWKKRCGVK